MTLNTSVNAIIQNNSDAFSRARVSTPTGLFDAQFTYDLQPLLFEQLVSGTGATVAHDATNRCALMTFSSTPTGGQACLQSYEFLRYQAGRSQLVFLTFNMIASVANCLKFAGYGDSSDGIFFENNGSQNQFKIYSSTGNGNQTVAQSAWNIDKLNGSGGSANPSGLTLDVTKTQILVISFQALYVGQVKIGFDINGEIIWCHEFNHANSATLPYIATANLPVKCGMTCTGTVSTTMRFICCSVISEGGEKQGFSYSFTGGNSVTAANGADTYCFSLRPKTTFNGITNRIKISLLHLDFSVTGANNVFWKLCLGQKLTTPSFADVNATYSGMQIDTAGTLSGAPLIVIDSGFASSSKVATSSSVVSRFPITLNAAGQTRTLGTYTLIVQGAGGNSAMSCQASWTEER